MNFSQTLELMDENGVTAYKLIEDSKRPANYGGPSLSLSPRLAGDSDLINYLISSNFFASSASKHIHPAL